MISSVTINYMGGHISSIVRDVYDFSKKNDVDCTFHFNGVEVFMGSEYNLNLENCADTILDAVQCGIMKVYFE